MAKDDPRQHPPDMSGVEGALRDFRYEADAVELDRIKQRALAQSEPSRHKGATVRSRSVAALVSGLLAVGTTAVAIAATGGGGPNNPSAASEQYHKHCKPHKHPNPHRKCERPPGQHRSEAKHRSAKPHGHRPGGGR